RRGRVVVPGLVLRADVEGMAPLGECRCERVGTRASRPRTAVETALEGDGTLVRAEVEGGIRFVRRIRRRRVDRRVRQTEVDRPGVGRRGGVGVAGLVGGASVEGVAAGT